MNKKRKELEMAYAWSQLYRNSLYQTKLAPKLFNEINKVRLMRKLKPLSFPIINNVRYTDQGALLREDGRSFDEVTQERITQLKKELGIAKKRNPSGENSKATASARPNSKR